MTLSQNEPPEGHYAPGLEGIVVAETELSKVDGQAGRLWVRGFDVEELAQSHHFEDVLGLLATGHLPSEAEALPRRLGEGRVRAHALLSRGAASLAAGSGMEALRATVGALPALDDDSEADRMLLAGMVAVALAAWHRTETARARVAPDPERRHAGDLLRMLSGEDPHPARERALDRYLTTVAEHGMNASTFTARVVASTGSDMVSAVVAALGALKGPLHGGAPGPVLDMLDAIGRPERAEAWLRSEVEAGRRIMGLGHRVYRVRDPRAAVLEDAVTDLEAAGVESRYLALARSVESSAVGVLAERYPERRLETNVEFYTAVLLDAVGVPRELFTPVFAVARVAGWLAHIREHQANGRIIRPSQRYVGPVPHAAAQA